MEFCKTLTRNDPLWEYLVYLENKDKMNLLLEEEAIYFVTEFESWVGIELLGIFTSYKDMEEKFNLNNIDFETYEEYGDYNKHFEDKYVRYEKIYTKDLILYGISSMYKYYTEQVKILQRLEKRANNEALIYKKQYDEIYNDCIADVFKEIDDSYSKIKKEFYKRIKD